MRLAAGILTVLLLASVSLSLAQTSTPAPKYNPATEATLKGIIGEIGQVQLGEVTHVDLMLKSGEEVMSIGVCPPDIFKDLIVTLAAGDEVQVIGSKVQIGDKPFIMAREITKGNDTLALRDKKGSPVWMWMRKSP